MPFIQDLPKKCDVPKTEAGPSFIDKNNSLESEQVRIVQPSKPEMDSTSLISEVRDILCDLGEGFIEVLFECLSASYFKNHFIISC